MAQSAPATAQTIEAYVGETMDDARMGPVHWQVLALVASLSGTERRRQPCLLPLAARFGLYLAQMSHRPAGWPTSRWHTL